MGSKTDLAADTSLPSPLYRAEQVRTLDRLAIEQGAIAGYTLMCRAAAEALAALRRRWPNATRIVVVCGGGNNAGDGYALARLARADGLQAVVSTLKAPESLVGDAAKAWHDAVDAGIDPQPFDTSALEQADVVVDAILGIGLQRELTGTWRDAVATVTDVNRVKSNVLALDIPTGLHADRGTIMGAAVEAALCVSFIGLKQGLFTGHGPLCCEEVDFAGLGVADEIRRQITPAAYLYRGGDLAALLPRRSRIAHKGDHGHLLAIGGNHGMAGAVRMAAEAAARSGSGLVSVATQPQHAAIQAALRPEVMFRGVDTAAALEPMIDRADVIAIGPGLGTDDWSRTLLSAALATELPLVVDADALNLLALSPIRRENWVLTPHPGEAGRLLGCNTAAVQADRFAAAAEIVARFGGVCVLKGAGTIVASTDSPPSVCASGNPGMATGGMGDVLTGIVGALIAQGLALADAALAGAYVHGRAADLAVVDGERGLLATDLMTPLRRLVNPR